MAVTLTNLIYHVIFSTKKRYPLIVAGVQKDLYAYIGEIITNRRGIMLEIGGIEDHIHIVMKMRADSSLSEMVRSVKANSSKWMNDRSRPVTTFLWQAGYGAFTVSSSNVARVREYVRRQQEHHKKKSFQEEYLAFLNRQELQFDEDSLWS